MQLSELINEAVERYRTAQPGERKVLETVFGKQTFKQFHDITERIKDFNDICNEAGVDIQDYLVSATMSDEQKFVQYAKKIRLIAQVLNEGVKLDYSKNNQQKWYPWFVWKGAGFGFSGSFFRCDGTTANVASRFASKKLSDFAGQTFIKEYNDYLNAQ